MIIDPKEYKKELIDIVDKKLEEFDDNTATDLKNYVLEIIKKIINFPNDCETTIAKMINYNHESNFVDPLTQGIIFNKVNEICKEIKINLQSTYDDFGGLAFYYTFIKMNENEIYEKPQKSNDVETENIIKDENTRKPETYCYDFIPYKQIGPIKLDIDDEKNYKNESVTFLANTRMNFVMCRPIALDSPEVIKRNGELLKIYIKYNEHKIKITSYLQKFIDDLKVICDDFFIEESYSNNVKYFYAYSAGLGIVLTGTEIDNQFFIHYLYFNGKDSFIKDLSIHNEENNR